MGKSTFRGGAHPYEGKELSMDHPIQKIMPKDILVFPMSQHIGAPATPVVAVGDAVKMGQKIGEASGFISANIISSVSGTVKAVEPRLLSSGSKSVCVVIENDGAYTPVEGLGQERDYTQLSRDEIRQIIKEAGIVGMGGAGFPTNVKVTPKNEDEIEYVIVNGAECEPYLTSDYRLMLEKPEALITGLKVLLSLFDHAQGIIAVEDNKPEAIAKLRYLTQNDGNIQVKELKTKYPQGGERQLIYAVTGRAINSKMLPADAGCVVDNVETLVSVYNAVKLGKPVMERIFTVTGDAVSEPCNFRFSIGMNFQELLDAAGGFKEQPEKIIAGGPMMGFALFDLNIPTTKTTSALLCLTKDEVAEFAESPCINCGRCVEACPELLVPSRLAKFANNGLSDMFEKWNGMECVECGSCSFICPAKRQLAQSIKTMKKTIIAERKKK